MTWKHFTKDELKCKCGCEVCEMDSQFMEMIENAREVNDIPFIVNRAYSCIKHDIEIGGSGNHPQGKAMDIAWKDTRELGIILLTLYGKAGFKRFGIDFKKKFLHVDSVQERVIPCIWGYDL